MNEQDVRIRVVNNNCSNFHVHSDNDELFMCLEGSVSIDIEGTGSISLQSNQLAVVPAGTRHRICSQKRSVLLVVDTIES
ncbi:cupin domain-containing protein [uncultured Ruegeria sp.]|uniref:cupin domain-containing protein n=1 Tax=uncultured Ruegeria sp. TaxID=259304 RepID=UPI00345C1698